MDGDDGRAIVRRGYDRVAQAFTAERIEEFPPAERAFLERVTASLPERGLALDLGCGPGQPMTEAIAARCDVIGVDLAWGQLAIARQRLPTVPLVQADMTEVAFRPASFDAVVAFWSVIHVPRDLHRALFARIAAWLRPNGIFAAVIGTEDNPDERQPDWLGAPMYWSHFDASTTLDLLRDAGFEVLHDERLPPGLPSDDGGPVGVLTRLSAASAADSGVSTPDR